MSKLSVKNKTILLGVISVLLVIAIVFVSAELICDINQNRFDKMVENKLYGTVSEVGKNYIKFKSLEDDEYLVSTTDDLKVGDFIVIYYKSSKEDLIENAEIEIVASEDEVVIKTTGTTKQVITTSEIMTSVAATNSVTKIVTTKTTTTVSSKDDSVLNYVKEKYENIDKEEIKDKAKTNFITVVDFIFYDGEINGVTWDSIKTSTKAKVVYYTLLMDSKLENKWPDYKENLKSKYDDIKSKLIAKYMDIITSLCTEHPYECEVTKNDFAVLKTSIGLTWDVIKTSFKYAYDKGVSYLVDWYEIYSGKR